MGIYRGWPRWAQAKDENRSFWKILECSPNAYGTKECEAISTGFPAFTVTEIGQTIMTNAFSDATYLGPA